MKTVMIIIDGLGDEPILELNNKTPLQASFIPNIHYVANRGQIGRIETTFDGFPIESMVCIMGLLGYEPERFYPSGRASFEVMAKGIPLNEGDLVLRCNTVSVNQEAQLSDFTAGLITDSHARTLISQIKLPHDNWELYPGQSYRNSLIIRGANVDVSKIKCFEPHMNIGMSIDSILPYGADDKTRELMLEVCSFLKTTRQQIAEMDVSKKGGADMLWVWSPSKKPVWPSFFERTGINAAFVGGLDFLHGIAMAAGIYFDVIPGATGYIDTNYQAKADYTIKHLQNYDFVLTHINATDEEAHQHNFTGKISAIEKVDKYIVGPILTELQEKYKDNYRIVICGDHTTRCWDGKHTDDPVPYAIFGEGILPGNTSQFSEVSCNEFPLTPSLDFLKQILWK